MTSRIDVFLFTLLCRGVSAKGCECPRLCSLSSLGTLFFRVHSRCWRLTGAAVRSALQGGHMPSSCLVGFGEVVEGAWGGGVRFGGSWYECFVGCSSFLANCLQESGAEKPPGRAAGQSATPAQLCHPLAFHHREHQQEDRHRLQHF